MYKNLSPYISLPMEFRREWQAELFPAAYGGDGAFKLVNIRRTQPKSYEELKIIVLVLDENNFPMANVKVAFSYSTAGLYEIGNDFKWVPPTPHRADIFPTGGSGQIEHVQGSVVKKGEPGGITVYIVEPDYASDYVAGCGALADHTGLHLTFQLRRKNVRSFGQRLDEMEETLGKLETRINQLTGSAK